MSKTVTPAIGPENSPPFSSADRASQPIPSKAAIKSGKTIFSPMLKPVQKDPPLELCAEDDRLCCPCVAEEALGCWSQSVQIIGPPPSS